MSTGTERMTPDLYAQTRYFKNYRTEGWGDPCGMARTLVNGADKLRHLASVPLIVHCGMEKRDKGYHPIGYAMDFHLVGIPLLQQLYLAMQVMEFVGIGVYPNWNNVGLHCDVRPWNNGTRKMWKCTGYKTLANGKRVQTYEKLKNIYTVVYR